ncbi:MAG: ion transporter [Rhizobiales bacterium]|nr:ion transporter [Hyphomicrobiales bacterium]
MAGSGQPRVSLRRRIYEIVERVEGDGILPRLFTVGLVTLILVNVAAAVLDSMPEAARYRAVFRAIENFSLVAFAIEYVVRLWVSVEHPRGRGVAAWRARLAYALTPGALIDLVALLPFVLQQFADVNLRVLLLVRLLRLFKLARYSTGFQALFEALRRERHALLACLLILISVVLVFAALMYTVERDAQPAVFGSIPQAMWWAMETVTTVGYGDVIPQTPLGRVIGGLTMIAGIVMLALPVAIIATSFAEVIRQRGFVVTYVMLLRIPLFQKLEREDDSEVLPMLRALTINAGATITAESRSHHGLFVVVDGKVEVDHPDGRLVLGDGDVFGGLPGIKVTESAHATYAVTMVRLLLLESVDYVRLQERRPGLDERMKAALAAAPAAEGV